MEPRRFEPDPAAARRRGLAGAAVFVASGAGVFVLHPDTIGSAIGGVLGALGVFALGWLLLRPAGADRFATLELDDTGFTNHRPDKEARRVAWSDVAKAYPHNSGIVAKLATGEQIIVSLAAQPAAARREIFTAFEHELGDRFTSFLQQKL
jgi:hypothetical protein|nr:hypothetical protein [Kofleriaceae bacterium]